MLQRNTEDAPPAKGDKSGSLHSNLSSSPIVAGVPTSEETDNHRKGPFVLDGMNLFVRRVNKDFTFFPGLGDRPKDLGDKSAYYVPPRLYYSRSVTKPDLNDNVGVSHHETPGTTDEEKRENRIDPSAKDVLVHIDVILGDQCHHVYITPVRPSSSEVGATMAQRYRSSTGEFKWARQHAEGP